MIKKIILSVISAFGYVSFAYSDLCLVEELEILFPIDCNLHQTIDYFKVCNTHESIMMGYFDAPSIATIYPQFFANNDRDLNILREQGFNMLSSANNFFSRSGSQIVANTNFIKFFTYQSSFRYHVGVEMSYGAAYREGSSFFVNFPLTHLLSFHDNRLSFSHILEGGIESNLEIIHEYLCANN